MPFLPTINFITPNWNPTHGGIVVTIVGMNFERIRFVRFGHTYANFSVLGPNTIQAIPPPKSLPGRVELVIAEDSRETISAKYRYFTYFNPIPPGSVRILAPAGGEVFESGKPITARWETDISAARHRVVLIITRARAELLSDTLPGSARSLTFSREALVPIQAAVQVVAFDRIGQFQIVVSQPFTISPSKEKETKEKEDKEKERKEIKELREGPR